MREVEIRLDHDAAKPLFTFLIEEGAPCKGRKEYHAAVVSTLNAGCSMKVAKNKDGECGKVELEFEGRWQRFKEVG